MKGNALKGKIMKRKNGYIAVCLIVFALCSCASSPTRRHRTQALYGMIYDRDNRPVSNVTLYVNDKPMASSDIHGRFIIPSLWPRQEYKITAKKENYETIRMDISFSDPSYVLYMRIFSSDQLLAEAEEALKERNWDRTESLLIRSRNAGGSSTSIQFLQGILLFYQEKYPQALEILSELGEREKTSPYLYLFMADICQYYLHEPLNAAQHLDKFLRLQFDPLIRQRRDELLSGD